MIRLEIPEKDWETAIKYWSAVSTNDKDKDKEKIDFLNKVIFNNEKKIDINEDNQVAVPSVTKMTQLMNEIEKDIDAAKTTFTLISSAVEDVDDTKDITKEILNKKENVVLKEFAIKPFSKMDSQFKNNAELQYEMLKQFCGPAEAGGSDGFYQAPRFPLLSFNDKEMCDKYSSIWNDFVSIRINLFETDLSTFFSNTLGVTKDELTVLGKYLQFYRNRCAILPVNTLGRFKSFDQFKKMTSILNSINDVYVNDNNNSGKKLHPIYMYYVIYQGIFSLMHHKKGFGGSEMTKLFDDRYKKENKWGEIREEIIKEEDKVVHKFDITQEKVCGLLFEYLVDQFCQTNIFGTYIPKDELTKAKETCKEILFGSNSGDIEKEFLKLLKYASQDISDYDSYQLLFNYNSWDKRYRSDDGGIEFFIINRLVYVIFHDLSIYNMQQKKNDKELMFPQLLHIFKFLYNFGVYCFCYPFTHEVILSKANEPFYLTQYFNLRHTTYKNVFGDNKYNIDAKLRDINYYFYHTGKDGTLLHICAKANYRQYGTILVRDGFGVDVYNRMSGSNKDTPFTIVEKSSKSLLRPLFEKYHKGQDDEKKQDSVQDNSKLISTVKSIEDNCNLFIKQTLFAKYLLICLGINVIDEMTNMKSEEVELQRGNYEFVRKYQSDELFVNFNHFNGLKLYDSPKGIEIMDGVYDGTMKLISTKMVFSDDFLILCWQYLQSNSIKNHENRTKEFISTLIECIRQCLTTKDDTRSYYYFKNFLLNSNIWLVKDYKNNKLLFDYIDELADELLMQQQNFLWKSVQDMQENDKENWNALCDLGSEAEKGEQDEKEVKEGKDEKEEKDENKEEKIEDFVISNKYFDSEIELRQDCIKNGIESTRSEKGIYVTNAKLDDEDVGKKRNKEKHDFDFFAEYNKIYITRCISFAMENNMYFQSQIKNKFYYYYASGRVRNAPIKKYDRCLIKSNTDYSDRAFPSGACILDFMRCSIQYETAAALLRDVKKFIKRVEKNEDPCFSKILRIKNGFKSILNWTSAKDCEYVDIKINALFNNKENSESQIVEIQFLLDFLVKAKQMGHKFYTIKRKDMFIDSIKHLVYDNNNNFENYQTKVITLINDNDLVKISKELIVQPHMILSMIHFQRPLLWQIGISKQYKMYKFFLNCLFHFGEILLNEKEPSKVVTIYDKSFNTMGVRSDNLFGGSVSALTNTIYKEIDAKNTLFLQKYFNFTHGGASVIAGTTFWGLRQTKFDNDAAAAFKLATIIMKSNYFNGVASNTTLYDCINSKDKECQDYLELVLSHLEKNKYGLLRSVSHEYWFDNETSFEKLMTIEKRRVEWLTIYFDVCNAVGGKPDLKQFRRGIKKCKNKRKEGTDEKAEKENKILQEMENILKENFEKMYPNEKMENDQ